MGRSPCCSKVGLNRGTWTAQEDKILTSYIKIHGEGQWKNLANRAGLKRCGKSCRLRWLNYLKPGIKRGNISHDEEELIIRLHNLLGNRWSLIAGRLPGRTANEIKNYWITAMQKKVKSITQSPSPQANHKGHSRGTKSIPTKTMAIQPRAVKCTRFVPLISSNPPLTSQNFDLQHNKVDAVNYSLDSELQCDVYQDYLIGTSNYPSDQSFFNFENNGDDPFHLSNCLLMEDWMANINGGGEYEINKNPFETESLEMFLRADKWP